MSKMNESKTLSESLDNSIDTWVLERLKDLEWSLDSDLFIKFQKRILGIIKESPESQDIVVNELDKTLIVAQNLQDAYKRTHQSILQPAANDEIFSPRTYWGKGNAWDEQQAA